MANETKYSVYVILAGIKLYKNNEIQPQKRLRFTLLCSVCSVLGTVDGSTLRTYMTLLWEKNVSLNMHLLIWIRSGREKDLIAKVHNEQLNKEHNSSMQGTFIVFISLKVCKYQLKTFFKYEENVLILTPYAYLYCFCHVNRMALFVASALHVFHWYSSVLVSAFPVHTMMR